MNMVNGWFAQENEASPPHDVESAGVRETQDIVVWRKRLAAGKTSDACSLSPRGRGYEAL